MNEVGIDISNQTSHVINPEILNNAALVTMRTRSRIPICKLFTCRTNSLGALVTRQQQQE